METRLETEYQENRKGTGNDHKMGAKLEFTYGERFEKLQLSTLEVRIKKVAI